MASTAKHNPLGPSHGSRSNALSRLSSLPTFDSLRVRDFRLIWLAQFGTAMGHWMDQVTRGWLIYTLTGSPLQLGLATAMRGIPLLLFGVLAGAVADRSGRKKQLIISQSTNALLSLVLGVLVISGRVQPWHIYVTGFLVGTVQAFQQPARQTLISDVVEPRRLMNALALNSVATNSTRTIGPAIAGVLIAVIGMGGSYLVQALVFVFATVWTIQLHVPDRSAARAGRAPEPFFASIAEGFRYVGKDRDIRTLVLLALAPVALGMPYTSLMPIFAKDVLHGGSALQGLILTFVGVGSLCGAVTVASVRRDRAYALPVVLAAAAFGVALMGFASSHWLVLSLAVAVLIGTFQTTYKTQDQTLLQTLAPPHIRGRVLSLYLLDRGLIPIGTLGAGFLAERYGGQDALVIMGAASVAVIALVLLFNPRFLRLSVPTAREAAGPGGHRRLDAGATGQGG